MLSCSPSNDIRRKMKKVLLALLVVYGLVSVGLVQTVHATESQKVITFDSKIK